MKLKLFLSLSIILSGCSLQTPRVLNQDNVFLIDTELGQICDRVECYNLDLIQPLFEELEIALAFGMPKKIYSWDASQLTVLLLTPEDKSYQAEQISNHEYLIPKTPATELTFKLLKDEDFSLYRRTPGSS